MVMGTAAAGAFAVVLLYVAASGKCNSAEQLLDEPLAALLPSYPVTPADGPYEDWLWQDPCTNEVWWGIFTIWLVLWGPICATFVGVGFVASRHGGPTSFGRSVLAAAFSAGLAFFFGKLFFRIRIDPVPMEQLVNALLFTCAAGACGALGTYLAKRRERDV
jgi:CDP-diglyceride synthetase